MATTKEDLVKQLQWIVTDMSYKAPEQMFSCVYTRWIPKLNDMIKELKQENESSENK